MENPQKSDHGPPPEGCHGLVLPNPSRAAFIGGGSSGKTCCILNTVARCHAWKPFDGGIYLMSPNNEAVRQGEYGIIDDITCFHTYRVNTHQTGAHSETDKPARAIHLRHIRRLNGLASGHFSGESTSDPSAPRLT